MRLEWWTLAWGSILLHVRLTARVWCVWPLQLGRAGDGDGHWHWHWDGHWLALHTGGRLEAPAESSSGGGGREARLQRCSEGPVLVRRLVLGLGRWGCCCCCSITRAWLVARSLARPPVGIEGAGWLAAGWLAAGWTGGGCALRSGTKHLGRFRLERTATRSLGNVARPPSPPCPALPALPACACRRSCAEPIGASPYERIAPSHGPSSLPDPSPVSVSLPPPIVPHDRAHLPPSGSPPSPRQPPPAAPCPPKRVEAPPGASCVYLRTDTHTDTRPPVSNTATTPTPAMTSFFGRLKSGTVSAPPLPCRPRTRNG